MGPYSEKQGEELGQFGGNGCNVREVNFVESIHQGRKRKRRTSWTSSLFATLVILRGK